MRQKIIPVHEYLDEIAKRYLKEKSKVPSPQGSSTAHMIVDGETKLVKITFDVKKYSTIELMMLTDLHYGNKMFQEDRFKEFRDWILARPNCFVLLGGDLIDSATPISVQNPFDNTVQPSDQILNLVELIGPLAGRIIGYVGGNHERRTMKTFGDAGQLIATLLRVKYSRGLQLIDVYYGKHNPFKISLWHGTGAARTKGARLNMLHRFIQQGDSQLYYCGHLHDVVATYDWKQRRDGDMIKLQKVAGIMSSSFLEYWNTFAEVVGLPPSDTMMGRVILEPNGHWEVTLR